jgi:hypothetical protein
MRIRKKWDIILHVHKLQKRVELEIEKCQRKMGTCTFEENLEKFYMTSEELLHQM